VPSKTGIGGGVLRCKLCTFGETIPAIEDNDKESSENNGVDSLYISTTATASIWPMAESVLHLATCIFLIHPKSRLQPTQRHRKVVVTCNDAVQVLAVVRHAAYADAILINLMMRLLGCWSLVGRVVLALLLNALRSKKDSGFEVYIITVPAFTVRSQGLNQHGLVPNLPTRLGSLFSTHHHLEEFRLLPLNSKALLMFELLNFPDLLLLLFHLADLLPLLCFKRKLLLLLLMLLLPLQANNQKYAHVQRKLLPTSDTVQ
jgi:hypothetical protein